MFVFSPSRSIVDKNIIFRISCSNTLPLFANSGDNKWAISSVVHLLSLGRLIAAYMALETCYH